MYKLKKWSEKIVREIIKLSENKNNLQIPKSDNEKNN